jgi:hypothetical protein
MVCPDSVISKTSSNCPHHYMSQSPVPTRVRNQPIQLNWSLLAVGLTSSQVYFSWIEVGRGCSQLDWSWLFGTNGYLRSSRLNADPHNTTLFDGDVLQHLAPRVTSFASNLSDTTEKPVCRNIDAVRNRYAIRRGQRSWRAS